MKRKRGLQRDDNGVRIPGLRTKWKKNKRERKTLTHPSIINQNFWTKKRWRNLLLRLSLSRRPGDVNIIFLYPALRLSVERHVVFHASRCCSVFCPSDYDLKAVMKAWDHVAPSFLRFEREVDFCRMYAGSSYASLSSPMPFCLCIYRCVFPFL